MVSVLSHVSWHHNTSCSYAIYVRVKFSHRLSSVELQDSAAVQILLEVCLPTSEEQQLGVNTESLLRSIRGILPGKSKEGMEPRGSRIIENAEMEGGLLSDLREVQCLICCLLHQMFIADPNIAKLVHFQVWGRAEGSVGVGFTA